jgi:hypothetical protein
MSEELENLAFEKLNEGHQPPIVGEQQNEQVALNSLGINDQQPANQEEQQQQEDPVNLGDERQQENEDSANESNPESVNADENSNQDLSFDIDLDEGTEVKPDDFVSKYRGTFEELGFEDIRSQDDFVAKFKQIKGELEEAKESSKTVFANDLIREANEIMKQGGDWVNYLGIASYDYDAVPDVDLLSYELMSDFDTKEELNDYISSLDETQIRLNAKRIRKDLKMQQETQKQAIALKAQNQQKAYDESLRKAINSVDRVDRVVVKDHDKVRIEKMLTSYNDKAKATEFQIKHFLKPNGEPDFPKMVQSAYKLEMFDKVLEYATRSAKNSGKASVIQNLSNVEKPTNTNIVSTTPRKAMSIVESEVERLMKGEKPLF